MGQVIDYTVFRTLRACRDINRAGDKIMQGVARMREDAKTTGEVLETTGRTLEHTMQQFSMARARLEEVGEQHRQVMEVVEKIMAESPAFRP